MKCIKCEHENRPQSMYCSSCGSKLSLICLSCKNENEIGDKFCGECGDRLTTDTELVDNSAKSTDTSDTIDSKPTELERSFIGERRSVTVLFADAKGFTSMSEKLNEEQVYNIMQEFIDLMVEVIKSNGGTVTQFLGDGLMALFGAPIAHENSSVKAVSAALNMQAALEKHAAEINKRFGADCHFRIGLNNGHLVV